MFALETQRTVWIYASQRLLLITSVPPFRINPQVIPGPTQQIGSDHKCYFTIQNRNINTNTVLAGVFYPTDRIAIAEQFAQTIYKIPKCTRDGK